MNPYLIEDNQPSETLQYTLDYYGISLDEFKAMTDEQVIAMVKRYSDVLNDGRITGAGIDGGGYVKPHKQGVDTCFVKKGMQILGSGNFKGDSGSFSRYFDLDKWFSERIKLLPVSVQKTFPFLIVPKASKSEKNKGCEDLPLLNNMRVNAPRESEGAKYKTKLSNNHPTVKPLKLMSYLITLGSREGDLVLDPFMGSGTTGIACKLLDRDFIGCEINKEYFDIAQKRIGSIPNKLDV